MVRTRAFMAVASRFVLLMKQLSAKARRRAVPGVTGFAGPVHFEERRRYQVP
jgi:hypothetical protein